MGFALANWTFCRDNYVSTKKYSTKLLYYLEKSTLCVRTKYVQAGTSTSPTSAWPNTRYKIPNTQYQIPNTPAKTNISRKSTREISSWLTTKSYTPNTKYQIPNTRTYISGTSTRQMSSWPTFSAFSPSAFSSQVCIRHLNSIAVSTRICMLMLMLMLMLVLNKLMLLMLLF